MLTELDDILAALDPRLDPVQYAYCAVASWRDIPWESQGLIAVVREDEACTLVIDWAEARDRGLKPGEAFRRISLGVHSSLHAVGLTAAAAAALTEQGVSANVMAGFYHDHFLVPAKSAQAALEALNSLANSARQATETT
jgi:hypothetical protein